MRLFKSLCVAAIITSLIVLIPRQSDAGTAEDEIRIPGDMIFTLELLSPISTERNKKGDEFTCRVIAPREYANAIVTGHISKLKSGGKANKKSELALAFDSITMAERSGKFDAQVTEVFEAVAGDKGRADEEGNVKGKSVRKRAVKIGVAGAVAGAIIGGLLGGGKGAAAGAAIGAGAGVASTLAVDAPNLEFAEGTQFNVRTTGRSR
ncbi:MAG TPA: hypothetical protein VKA70_08725 [Blastocatellia bacterium]|nr:hypothetical protein [Blastocatellia bacterium]